MVITDISFSHLWLKLRLKQDSWFYSHPDHCPLGGNLQMACLASPPGICLLSTPNNQFLTSLQKIYDDRICFLCEQSGEMEEGYGPLVGKFQCLPPPWSPWAPCHSLVELFSISSLKVWGNIQELHHDIAYLLVCIGNTTEDRHYGVSLVWLNPNQARASTMEEAVETLTACPSSGTNWSYALAQLYEGSCYAPLPKDKHLGILPQGKVGETSCGWISQLDVCQLHSTSPQLVYPIDLNRQDEPIITTLPELLSSSISVIISKHLYLGIDIPPMEEPVTKAPPIGEASTILITSPHKSPPKLEGSMTTEVNDLLLQAVTEASSCKSKHSSPLPCATAHNHLGELWLLCITFYWGKHPCCLHLFCHQGLTLQRNSHPQSLLPHQCPNSLQDQKAMSFARANREHASGWSCPKGYGWRTSQPQEARDPSLVQVT